MNSFNKKIFWLNVVVVFLFVVDRFSKWLALNALPSDGIFIIPKAAGLILERNQGIAYSISLPAGLLLVTASVIILVLLILLINAYRRSEVENTLALSLIVAGAVSNLIDRLQYGYVIDLIVLTSWPVFNLADIMILAGVLWLVLRIVKKRKSTTS